MEKLLSVIVPVYNAELYLKQCVDSLLEAATPDVEIILVNDGSADNSGRICDMYDKESVYIKAIHQENKGVISARKEGLKQASGRYVTFVDSDDWISREMYREMLQKVKEYDADICVCGMVRETETGQIFLPNYVEDGFYDKARLQKEYYPIMLYDFCVSAPAVNPSLCNKIIRKSLLEQVIYHVDDAIVFGEDALCIYPVMLDAQSIYVLKKEYYHYRQNLFSVTNVYDKNLMRKFLLLHEELKRQFTDRNFDFQKQLDGYTGRYSLVCVRKELLDNKEESLYNRMKTVKRYLNDTRVEKAFCFSASLVKDKKLKLKMLLAYQKQLVLLYLIFSFTEWMTQKKEEKVKKSFA